MCTGPVFQLSVGDIFMGIYLYHKHACSGCMCATLGPFNSFSFNIFKGTAAWDDICISDGFWLITSVLFVQLLIFLKEDGVQLSLFTLWNNCTNALTYFCWSYYGLQAAVIFRIRNSPHYIKSFIFDWVDLLPVFFGWYFLVFAHSTILVVSWKLCVQHSRIGSQWSAVCQSQRIGSTVRQTETSHTSWSGTVSSPTRRRSSIPHSPYSCLLVHMPDGWCLSLNKTYMCIAVVFIWIWSWPFVWKFLFLTIIQCHRGS
jgi:hypothetical protein